MKLQIENLYKSFGEKEVLKGISFSAESGKALGLLGRNGAGKTTTIRIIMGVFGPNSGQIFIDGEPINRNKLNIGYLPEEHGLYPKEKISSQIVYFARLRGMKNEKAKTSLKYWMERLGMLEYYNKPLETLSKGNQQKIQLAAALVTNPDIVILDEPFSGLDPVNASVLKDIVKELIKNKKIVLFSSHQMNYVEEFCDNIAILNEGTIALSGSIKQIKRSYDRSRLIVKSNAAQDVISCINTFPSSLVSSVQLKNGDIDIKLPAEDKKGELISALAQKCPDVDSVAVFEPSLNDIFVEYTANSASTEEAAI